jgi:hypothetical protein
VRESTDFGSALPRTPTRPRPWTLRQTWPPSRRSAGCTTPGAGVEAFPGLRCPFWEEGGVVVPPGCELERLGIDLERPDLTGYLLEIRTSLEAARDREERNTARRVFAALVPPDVSGR